MKLSVKISMLALAAIFTFSTPADAQWGSLINSARKAAGIKTKKEKAQEEQLRKLQEQHAMEEKIRQHKRDSIKAVMASITPTIPQPAAEGTAPVAIKWKNTQIGTWDPVGLEITFNQTYDEGEFAGQKVSYRLNPSTGQWISKKGTDVGRMSNDGTIVSPNLGTIKFNPQTNKIVRNGEVIGEVTMLSAYSYGTTIGGFDAHVSPLLIAFTFHGSLISEKQIDEWKEAKKQRELAAAKARQEAAARAANSSRDIDLWRNGSRFGELRSNGDVWINGSRRGELRSNGDIWVNGSRQGEFRSNGDIWKNGSRIGEVRSNGDIWMNGSRIGEVRSNGDIWYNGSRIGEARGMSSNDVRKVAVIYFYGFF